MTVPAELVAETLETAGEDGMKIRRKPNEIFDDSFVEPLEKSGFIKDLWGAAPAERRQ